VLPQRGGDFGVLFERSVAPEDPGHALLGKVATIAALVPGTPRPILVCYGPEGSGKATAAKAVGRIIDPSWPETIRRIPKPEELAQRLDHSWAVILDNLSTLSEGVQGALSAAVTGDGDVRRELYTTADDYIMAYKRVVLLTGIGVALMRPDALERSLLSGFARIRPEQRREEKHFWEEYEAGRPLLLGGALDILTKALTIMPAVRIAAPQRMADFTYLGYATAEAAGWGGGAFLNAYEKNVGRQREEAVAASAVAQVILKLMDGRADAWEGTPTQLKAALDGIARGLGIDPSDKRSGWPQDATRLGNAVTGVAATLAAVGFVVKRITLGHARGHTISYEDRKNERR
jgi:hypothetical protein